MFNASTKNVQLFGAHQPVSASLHVSAYWKLEACNFPFSVMTPSKAVFLSSSDTWKCCSFALGTALEDAEYNCLNEMAW